MSNNSMVCPDGAEIGRAQYLQAQAAGLEPESAMNPVLLKPGTDRPGFVVVRGQPPGRSRRGSLPPGDGTWREAAFAAYGELADRYDLVVCEGAGRRPRSTYGPVTTSTWAWRGSSSCRWSWSATSTGAASSPPCTARRAAGRR